MLAGGAPVGGAYTARRLAASLSIGRATSMPKRKKEILRALPPDAKVKARWMVYSSNREHCFNDEIQRGYFGSDHYCGCRSCDPQLEIPTPIFTRLPGEVR